MPTYRIEEASTGRAGCKNKECLDKKEKILKGELRLGSWVESEKFQSWSWKHWGCVTPKQVASMQEIVEDNDFSLLDGYDEISAENQEKIREAVAQGHVADSDWKGDVEVNRPGKVGFRVRASSKKKAGSDTKKDVTQDDKAEKPKTSKRGKKKDEESDEEDDEPVSKKAKTTSKKRKSLKTSSEDEKEEAGKEEDAGEKDAEVPEEKGNRRRKSGEQTSKRKSSKVEAESPKKSSRAKKSEGTRRVTRSQRSAA